MLGTSIVMLCAQTPLCYTPNGCHTSDFDCRGRRRLGGLGLLNQKEEGRAKGLVSREEEGCWAQVLLHCAPKYYRTTHPMDATLVTLIEKGKGG